MECDKLYTLTELCDYLCIGRNTALTLIREKKIRAFKAGKHWMIPADEIATYIQNELEQQS